MRRALGALLLVAAGIAGPAAASPAQAAPGAGATATAQAAVEQAVVERAAPSRAVVERRVIGRSVQGRPILAWRLGESAEQAGRPVPRVLLMATMHGDEAASRGILTALRDGRRIRGVDLWVLPVVNPDGLARGTRANARGVDLNRNYPHRWRDLDGRYESGRRAGSEPETRALMAFVDEVRPDVVLSFHQPLHGVDTDAKDPALAREVARRLGLPRTTLSCGGVCHGTMTGWFNARFPGSMLTVEHGAHPSRRTMTVDAPRQVLAALGARRAGD